MNFGTIIGFFAQQQAIGKLDLDERESDELVFFFSVTSFIRVSGKTYPVNEGVGPRLGVAITAGIYRRCGHAEARPYKRVPCQIEG